MRVLFVYRNVLTIPLVNWKNCFLHTRIIHIYICIIITYRYVDNFPMQKFDPSPRGHTQIFMCSMQVSKWDYLRTCTYYYNNDGWNNKYTSSGFNRFTCVFRKSRYKGRGENNCEETVEGLGNEDNEDGGPRVFGKNKIKQKRREKRVKGERMRARCSTVISLSHAASCACPGPGLTLPFHIHYTCTRAFSGKCDWKIDDVISRFLCCCSRHSF